MYKTKHSLLYLLTWRLASDNFRAVIPGVTVFGCFLIHLYVTLNMSLPFMTVDNENGLDYDDEQSPSSPTNKSLPRSVSGTTVSSQGTQSGKSKKPFFKKVTLL